MARAESQRRAVARIGIMLVASFVLMMVVAGCSGGTLGVDADENGVHVSATGKASGSATAYLEVPNGEGIRIEPAITEGSILVKISDGRNVIRFEGTMTGDTTVLVPDAWGECNMVVEAHDAEGTVEISSYVVPVEELESSDESSESSEASSKSKGKESSSSASSDAKDAKQSR